jgi:hypothetical protein
MELIKIKRERVSNPRLKVKIILILEKKKLLLINLKKIKIVGKYLFLK